MKMRSCLSLIIAARNTIEAAARRVLVTQTWRLAFDAWPTPRNCSRDIAGLASPLVLAIPFAQVASASAVRVYDATGMPQVLAPATYMLLGAPNAARLLFATAPPAPGRAIGGIEIDIVAGYGAPPDVPQPLRNAVLMLVAWWFERRGDDPDDRIHLPAAIAALVAPFRRLRLA